MQRNVRARMQSHGLCCIPPMAPVSTAVAYSIVIQSGRTEDAIIKKKKENDDDGRPGVCCSSSFNSIDIRRDRDTRLLLSTAHTHTRTYVRTELNNIIISRRRSYSVHFHGLPLAVARTSVYYWAHFYILPTNIQSSVLWCPATCIGHNNVCLWCWNQKRRMRQQRLPY